MLVSLTCQLNEPAMKLVALIVQLTHPSLSAQLARFSSDVKRLHTESSWNAKYLNILRKPFSTLATGGMRQVNTCIGGMVNTLKMVWSSSRFYNTPYRMVSKLCACWFRLPWS